jgi:hypothetical protein
VTAAFLALGRRIAREVIFASVFDGFGTWRYDI